MLHHTDTGTLGKSPGLYPLLGNRAEFVCYNVITRLSQSSVVTVVESFLEKTVWKTTPYQPIAIQTLRCVRASTNGSWRQWHWTAITHSWPQSLELAGSHTKQTKVCELRQDLAHLGPYRFMPAKLESVSKIRSIMSWPIRTQNTALTLL